ncbi:MAG: LD-carboxypeptidase [Defluviitaleaceae bacterium]|nr:LD-carboxypeptidase [Defluviitaleaceae bacterium]
MIFPPALNPKDRIALIAPAGYVEHDKLHLAVDAVKNLGFLPILGKYCALRKGFLAGTDEQRAADFNWAFADTDIKAIICLRGGYGAQRILDKIDFDSIARNPKIFCGYSDITALHTAINQLTGMITFHTPMAATELYRLDNYSLASFLCAISGKDYFAKNPQGHNMQWLVKGKAAGLLCGGNLSLLVSSVGTPYEINTHNKILFIEETAEPPYKIDRMLRQLKYSGKLNASAGIILGSFEDCGNRAEILEILRELELKIPTLFNFRCGHCLPTASIPLGAAITLDSRFAGFRVAFGANSQNQRH